MAKVLIIGASGQIGTELTLALQARYGHEEVITADLRQPSSLLEGSIFEPLDVLNKEKLSSLVRKYKVQQLYHLAALLSAKGEKDPIHTWKLNAEGTLGVLEVARASALQQVFFPSSIAVFGSSSPRKNTPQQCYLNPSSMYGLTKMVGEQLCAYYRSKYALDVRSLRYPGLVGGRQSPGGGTTDYAVSIFKACIQKSVFSCYLRADTRLPMMHIQDAISGTIQLMEAPFERLSVEDSYNFSAMSFSPAELLEAIRVHYPDFEVRYAPDHRQQIAESWPESIDDSAARRDWYWRPQYDLPQLVEAVLDEVSKHA